MVKKNGDTDTMKQFLPSGICMPSCVSLKMQDTLETKLVFVLFFLNISLPVFEKTEEQFRVIYS